MAVLNEDAGMRTLARWAMEEAALTCPHPLCRAANVAYVTALAYGVRSGSPKDMHRAALTATARAISESTTCRRQNSPAYWTAWNARRLSALPSIRTT